MRYGQDRRVRSLAGHDDAGRADITPYRKRAQGFGGMMSGDSKQTSRARRCGPTRRSAAMK
jgi:hypothetical protein